MPVHWRISPWDHQLHAYHEFGELISEALCSHSARTNKLTQGEARRCVACLLILGTRLADHHGDPTQWPT